MIKKVSSFKHVFSFTSDEKKQNKADHTSMVETILGDALNIFDVILWTEKGGHALINQRDEGDGTVRVLIQPKA